MIYSVNEGLFDRFKKKSKDNKINKHNIKCKNNTNQIKKPTYTEKQYDEIIEKAREYFNKYIPIFADIAKKELSKSELCKKNFTIENSVKGEDDVEIYESNRVIAWNFISYDLWDIEPNARTEYHTSGKITEAFDIHHNIMNTIKAYCDKNNIYIRFEDVGDWDSIATGISIPISSLELSFKEVSTIFEFVKFI